MADMRIKSPLHQQPAEATVPQMAPCCVKRFTASALGSHTVTALPASSKRAAIAPPMWPTPMNPMRFIRR